VVAMTASSRGCCDTGRTRVIRSRSGRGRGHHKNTDIAGVARPDVVVVVAVVYDDPNDVPPQMTGLVATLYRFCKTKAKIVSKRDAAADVEIRGRAKIDYP